MIIIYCIQKLFDLFSHHRIILSRYAYIDLFSNISVVILPIKNLKKIKTNPKVSKKMSHNIKRSLSEMNMDNSCTTTSSNTNSTSTSSATNTMTTTMSSTSMTCSPENNIGDESTPSKKRRLASHEEEKEVMRNVVVIASGDSIVPLRDRRSYARVRAGLEAFNENVEPENEKLIEDVIQLIACFAIGEPERCFLCSKDENVVPSDCCMGLGQLFEGKKAVLRMRLDPTDDDFLCVRCVRELSVASVRNCGHRDEEWKFYQCGDCDRKSIQCDGCHVPDGSRKAGFSACECMHKTSSANTGIRECDGKMYCSKCLQTCLCCNVSERSACNVWKDPELCEICSDEVHQRIVFGPDQYY